MLPLLKPRKKPMTKAKLALCIDTPEFIEAMKDTTRVLDPIGDVFYDVPARLIDRAICETDEKTLQLLPYIAIKDSNGNLLRYSRGKGGAEERLKVNTSVGLGGHVDVGVDYDADEDLFYVLQNEAKRELKEEIGIDVIGELNFTHLIIDRTNPVGRVHLGLLAVYTLPEGQTIRAEELEIADPEFVSPAVAAIPSHYAKLENWSQMVVDYLMPY